MQTARLLARHVVSPDAVVPDRRGRAAARGAARAAAGRGRTSAPVRSARTCSPSSPDRSRRRRRGREHHRGRARARHRRLARRALEPRARRVVRDRARATSSRAGTRASRPTSAAPRSTSTASSPTSTRSTACRWSPPRCTASCPRSRSRSRRARPDARLAYVMTDGAALPLALSRPRRRRCATAGLIDATITCGHAFGGDYEAVSVYSALAVARHVVDADAAVVVMGPGIVGTGTRLGFSGIEVGPGARRRHRARRRADRVPARVVRRRARPATRASRTTRSRRLRIACRSRVTVPVPTVGGERRGRHPRRPRATAGIDRAPRPRRRRADRHRRARSRRTACTSRRWAGPRPTIRCCSRRPPPPGSLAATRVTAPVSLDRT